MSSAKRRGPMDAFVTRPAADKRAKATAGAAPGSDDVQAPQDAGRGAPAAAAAPWDGVIHRKPAAQPGSSSCSSQQQQQQLDRPGLRQLAAKNQAAVTAALASATGRQPCLAELLVEPSWRAVLGPQLQSPQMRGLQAFLEAEWASQTVYPAKADIFRAFNAVPLHQVRVVILGQDPYINPREAMGLSFSVPPGVRVPPSLGNIYRELAADLGCSIPKHGCLQKWCEQGVLLLNACLTVRAKASNSHAGKGWEALTSAALSAIAQQRRGVVFLLWGKYAQDRCKAIDLSQQHVLTSVHPSPLSAHRGFLGCRHFSAANAKLLAAGLPAIDWQIEEEA